MQISINPKIRGKAGKCSMQCLTGKIEASDKTDGPAALSFTAHTFKTDFLVHLVMKYELSNDI